MARVSQAGQVSNHIGIVFHVRILGLVLNSTVYFAIDVENRIGSFKVRLDDHVLRVLRQAPFDGHGDGQTVARVGLSAHDKTVEPGAQGDHAYTRRDKQVKHRESGHILVPPEMPYIFFKCFDFHDIVEQDRAVRAALHNVGHDGKKRLGMPQTPPVVSITKAPFPDFWHNAVPSFRRHAGRRINT